jgi:aminoglycoside 3-N-acetyltransferase
MPSYTSQQQIEEELRSLGLGAGDVVLLHASLASFGFVEGGAQTVASAFLAVLGEEGTLVTPAFEGAGALASWLSEHPLATHSNHPLAPVAALGAHADAICKDHWKAESPHGPHTPFTRVAGLGGYVCLAGVDLNSNTTLHTVEAMLDLPYLDEGTLPVETEEGCQTRTWRNMPSGHRDFTRLEPMLRAKGILRMGHVGSCILRLMLSQELINVSIEAVREDPMLLLCKNPNCRDCQQHRALIRRQRLEKESFRLALSSGLAGRYVLEMAETMGRCGITAVELDVLEGEPVHRLPRSVLKKAVLALRAEGLEITALRSRSVPESVADFMDRAVENAVPRVVLPLVSAAEQYAQAAADRGLRLSLFNHVQGSLQASRMLMSFDEAGLEVGFTLNPAAFAAAGEMPAHYSYTQKLNRFTDQIDLEDGGHDGTPRPLGEGQAEVKDLISRLRCASFSGILVLTPANRDMGGVNNAIRRFEEFLFP